MIINKLIINNNNEINEKLMSRKVKLNTSNKYLILAFTRGTDLCISVVSELHSKSLKSVLQFNLQ